VTLAPFFSPALPPAGGAVAVTRARAFEAAHAYRDPAFGPAARLHGHNYLVSATVCGPIDPALGYLADIRGLDVVLRAVVDPLDHRRLDTEYAALRGREPCVEAIAASLFAALAARVPAELPGARLAALRVNETSELWADVTGGTEMELTRAYDFSAAHRLADPGRTDEENRRIYGKCASPSAHGHDYRVEVSVRGRPDPRSGTITDLAALDRAVEERVIGPFDHRYLNAEVAPFDTVVPTGERIAERIWELLAEHVPGLCRVVVYETPRSAFRYEGPA
jgi:6-pyruvoyltetrahydropterin/6-carboxytetrahydropterin synthase